MRKLAEFGHKLWIDLQLDAPPLVQRTMIPLLHQAKEVGRILVKPSLTLYQLQGYNEAGPLTVVYGGLGFARPMLESLLFTQAPTEQTIGSVPLWSLSQVAECLAGDLIIIEASNYLVDQLPRDHALVLPWWVDLVLDVQGEWEEVTQRFHGSVRGQDMRRVRKYGYEYEVSHRNEDFDLFYHKMYLPSMEARHGQLASPLPLAEAYQYFRRGWLFLIKRDGDYVAGCICFAQQGVVKFREIGVLNGDEQLMREGAQGAVYYAMVHWANKNSYNAVDFLGSWPYMSLGMFRYKRKWGSTVRLSALEHKRIWLKIQRFTPAVSEFLQKNPCIITAENGGLQGLIVTSDPHHITPGLRAEWRKLYETPGLENLLICTPENLVSLSTQLSGKEMQARNQPGAVV